VFSARADEIRLKGGKKLYGVNAWRYEDNMFKSRLILDMSLIEKDKIESIIPSTPAGNRKRHRWEERYKPASLKTSGLIRSHRPEPAVASSSDAFGDTNERERKDRRPGTAGENGQNDAENKRRGCENRSSSEVQRRPMSQRLLSKDLRRQRRTGPGAGCGVPRAPKEPEVPANREEVLGESDTRITLIASGCTKRRAGLDRRRRAERFRTRSVAMGTSNESTLMWLAVEEKTKEPLDAAAAAVGEAAARRLANYQRLSERKTVVGGLPAVEYQYRGKATSTTGRENWWLLRAARTCSRCWP